MKIKKIKMKMKRIYKMKPNINNQRKKKMMMMNNLQKKRKNNKKILKMQKKIKIMKIRN